MTDPEETAGRTSPARHRAGVVALVGPPNVGKSTLLNRLVGEKIAIVTRKPQTTRSRILGVLTRDGAQVLLLDTPGLHEGAGALHDAMHRASDQALVDCDLALLLIDRTRGWEPVHSAARERLVVLGRPWLCVGTKADLAGARPWPPPEAAGGEVFLVSGRTGAGTKPLLDAIVARLPEGPAWHDADTLTDRPLRFLAAELVREAAFELLNEELPYAIGVEIDAFDESRPDLVHIRANLLVERTSQKRIVIGSGGERIRAIGIRARREIERLLASRVHLELWVKEDARWTRRAKRVEELGYR